jgi:hypothetical protein
MRYGLGSIPDCLSLKFGGCETYVKRLMSEAHSKIRQIFLCGAKCLSLAILFS